MHQNTTNNEEFVVFILTHGRPDRVYTYSTLRRSGYTGKIYLVVDTSDKKIHEYLEKYPGEVLIFNKDDYEGTFDSADNFKNKRGVIIYARNASFDLAEKIGAKYFLQLDDDYNQFHYRFDAKYNYSAKYIGKLDEIFDAVLSFYKSTNFITFAIAQGGDFIGGRYCEKASAIQLMRKCMNSFFCRTDRRFNFVGRINEDVNTYVSFGSRGILLGSTNQVSLNQKSTQQNAGGMTEVYLDSGTYLKSFYSIVFNPSSVRIRMMSGGANARLHHSISWKNTVPKIVSESLRKL